MAKEKPDQPSQRVPPKHASQPRRAAWRDELYVIIFEADTRAGQVFDIILLVAILLSITVVSLETVQYFDQTEPWPWVLHKIEWTLTLLFTAEYFARLLCVRKPLKYAFSFFGLIDLLACLPLYLTFFSWDSKSLMIVRSVRLLRVFRVLKMMRMLREAHSLQDAIWKARDKIFVFVAVVMVAVTISGTIMYQLEHDENNPTDKFTSIPQAMYWAIVTMTTVGYGDITPTTTAGKIVSAILILLGYSLIIVPTGFVSAEIQKGQPIITSRTCSHCFREGHLIDAVYCDQCGERLIVAQPPPDANN